MAIARNRKGGRNESDSACSEDSFRPPTETRPHDDRSRERLPTLGARRTRVSRRAPQIPARGCQRSVAMAMFVVMLMAVSLMRVSLSEFFGVGKRFFRVGHCFSLTATTAEKNALSSDIDLHWRPHQPEHAIGVHCTELLCLSRAPVFG